jgi:hypothetical protein
MFLFAKQRFLLRDLLSSPQLAPPMVLWIYRHLVVISGNKGGSSNSTKLQYEEKNYWAHHVIPTWIVEASINEITAYIDPLKKAAKS